MEAGLGVRTLTGKDVVYAYDVDPVKTFCEGSPSDTFTSA